MADRQAGNGRPPVHKKTSFRLCLILGVLFLLSAASRLATNNIYERQGWFGAFVVGAVLLVAAYFLKRRNDAEARAHAEARQKELEEEEAKLRRMEEETARIKEAAARAEAERKQRQQEWEQHHGQIVMRVSGVTYYNEDGTSRQAQLRKAFDEESCGSVTLEHYDHEGEDAIRVLYEGVGVGNVPRPLVNDVLAVMDKITAGHLDAAWFVPDDEDDERSSRDRIYRADLTLVYSKD